MAHLLTDQLRLMAENFADQTGYVNCGSGESLTFAEWDARSNGVARALAAKGVAKGDRVTLLIAADEPLAWMVAYSAIHKAGAVAVPTNTRLTERELVYVIDHSGAIAGLVSEKWSDIGVATVMTTTTWDDSDTEPFQVELTGDDMADLMYTSGTTGRPKAVVVRHRNVAMVPNGLPRWTGAGWLHASPMFTFAGIASVYNPMKLGMTGMYLPKFDTGKWLEIVAQRRPSAGFVVPAMAQLLLADERWATADLSSLHLVTLGSAPVAPETIRQMRARLPGCTVTNGWGMTEAGPAFCYTPPEEVERRIGSVGKPMPPTEFRIIDDDGAVQLANTEGELLVRNPGKEREYFNEPEITAATWQDGWLHTGDIAYLDEDGYLYIVGRKKDVIIRGGNNIHAGDVEDELYTHPAVLEAAVAAVPHAVLGEDVGAWVVLKPGATATKEELIAHVAESLADYKVPRHVTFLDELPRNATGKVVKADLPR